MVKLLAAPTKNAVQKTLAAQLLSTATTGDPITFDDVDGIPNLPGVLVIRRVSSAGVATPEYREYIEYSGTSGTTVIIETRNVDGSNAALTHPIGSIVEFIPDVTWADRIYDALATLVDATNTSVINPSIVTTPLSTAHAISSSGATISGFLDDDTFATASATTLPTSESVKAYVDANASSSDGWSAATGTWTYASATTITVPSGATSIYQIGDKFKLTANSVVLYGYIVAVADTLLTVKGDALTNHTFTANYFSKALNPKGFPTSFSWTPTFGGFSSPPSSPVARFSIFGRTVFLNLVTGNGTSNANTFTISLPVAAKTISGVSWRNRMSNLVDNGTNSTTIDFSFIDSGATSLAIAKNFSTTGFTTSGNKGADCQVFYEI